MPLLRAVSNYRYDVLVPAKPEEHPCVGTPHRIVRQIGDECIRPGAPGSYPTKFESTGSAGESQYPRRGQGLHDLSRDVNVARVDIVESWVVDENNL